MEQNIEAKKIGIVAGDNTKIIYQSPLQALLKPSLCTCVGLILFALALYLVTVAGEIGLMPLALKAVDMSAMGAVFIFVGEFWDYQIKKA